MEHAGTGANYVILTKRNKLQHEKNPAPYLVYEFIFIVLFVNLYLRKIINIKKKKKKKTLTCLNVDVSTKFSEIFVA